MKARHFSIFALPALVLATFSVLAFGDGSGATEARREDGATPAAAANHTGDAVGRAVGDVTIRSIVFDGERASGTMGKEGMIDASTGEMLSQSLSSLRGGEGDLVGELVHVGRGCDQASGFPQVLADGRVVLKASYDADPAGKIALIERGGCTFSVKVGLAQLVGASGVIIYNQPLDPEVPLSGDVLVQMEAFPGTFPPGVEEIDIPVAFVTHSDGLALAAAAPAVIRVEGAAFAVVEESVARLVARHGLPREAARSLMSKVADAREATVAGDYEHAVALLFAFQDELLALLTDGDITMEDAVKPFYAADPVIAALAKAAFPAAM